MKRILFLQGAKANIEVTSTAQHVVLLAERLRPRRTGIWDSKHLPSRWRNRNRTQRGRSRSGTIGSNSGPRARRIEGKRDRSQSKIAIGIHNSRQRLVEAQQTGEITKSCKTHGCVDIGLGWISQRKALSDDRSLESRLWGRQREQQRRQSVQTWLLRDAQEIFLALWSWRSHQGLFAGAKTRLQFASGRKDKE